MSGEYSKEKKKVGQAYPLMAVLAAGYGPVIIVAIIYFAAAQLSLFLSFENTNVSPVWPPTGIALASVLLLGYRMAPGIFAGAFLANILALMKIGFPGHDAVIAACGTAAGNMSAALVGAMLIRRLTGNSYPFARVGHTAVFVVCGALVSSMLSSTIGVTSLCHLQKNWDLYRSFWLTWWLGDAAGAIITVPILLAWKEFHPSEWGVSRIIEFLLFLVILYALSYVVFGRDNQLRFLILPVFIWVVFRFGFFETSLSLALVSGMAIYRTVTTMDPRTDPALINNVLFLQSYIATIAVTGLFLSVVVKERKLSEEALRTEKTFSDTIINSVPGAFYLLDSRGRLSRWNRFLEEINNLSPEELKGMDSLRNIHEKDRQLISDKIAEAFEKGESQAEGRICTNDGTRYFLFTGRRIDTEAGPYVVGSGIDITGLKTAEMKVREYQKNLEKMVGERTAQLTATNAVLESEIEERKKLEETLIESEKKYRDLVESANSVILRWTKEGRITFINKFAQNFFGYSEEEILGQNIIGTIVPAAESTGRDLSTLAIDIYENTESYVINENENIKKSGERVWVAWTNRAIVDQDGRIVEILSVGNDITQRKQVEDRLKWTLKELEAAKERAEAADHLKSAFLATMSHELRTPLNSIIGFTGIILQGYVGPLNDEQTKQLGMVRNSANHLHALINDVLDISKIEAGQLDISSDSFNLRMLMEKTLESSRPAADKKGLLLSLNVSPDVGVIKSDSRRVEQILLNLLSNAVKFTEQGEVHVECMRLDGKVQVCVRDTGIGIKDEDMSKLFKAFQQVDAGMTRRYDGTGLGLYICRRLAELLGGNIWVTSKWGEGSTFCFSLPVEREAL